MRYCFGPFTLDPANRLLLYRDKNDDVWRLKLPTKSLGVLIFLVENAGQTLTNEKIYSAVWCQDPNDRISKSVKDSVQQEISQIRLWMGDRGREEYIGSIKFTGYCFKKSVRQEMIPSDPTPFPPERGPLGTVSSATHLKRIRKIQSEADRLLLYLVLSKEEEDFEKLGALTGRSAEALVDHLIRLIDHITRLDDYAPWQEIFVKPVAEVRRWSKKF